MNYINYDPKIPFSPKAWLKRNMDAIGFISACALFIWGYILLFSL